MGRRYTQLTIDERWAIAHLHAAGRSIRQIAATLDRQPSTIARELTRNRSRTQGYQPRYADQQARARRWRGARLDRDPAWRHRVLAGLTQGWSPEQVAGRLAREARQRVISHESIYRFLYAQLTRTNDFAWRHYLPQAKSTRGWRGRTGRSPASFIAHRRPLADRPSAAADRQTPGHWEADLMLFRTAGQASSPSTSATLASSSPPARLAKPAAPIAPRPGPAPGPAPAPLAPDPHLRQRHRVRPPSPPPCPRPRHLLL